MFEKIYNDDTCGLFQATSILCDLSQSNGDKDITEKYRQYVFVNHSTDDEKEKYFCHNQENSCFLLNFAKYDNEVYFENIYHLFEIFGYKDMFMKHLECKDDEGKKVSDFCDL